jgi:uncharacterized protein YjeT (DUF2065 family)
MGALRRHRFLIAWIAVIGLMTNLAAAALCCVPDKTAAPDNQITVVDDFAICLHDGAAPLQRDEGTAPEPAVKPCLHCLATPAVAFVLALGAIFGLIAGPARTRIAFGFIPVPDDDLRRAGLGSRAPPLSA